MPSNAGGDGPNAAGVRSSAKRDIDRCVMRVFERKNMNTYTNNAKPLLLLQQAFDALDTADSEIDCFESEEEEAEGAPEQYACRKIMEAMDLLRAANRERLLGA